MNWMYIMYIMINVAPIFISLVAFFGVDSMMKEIKHNFLELEKRMKKLEEHNKIDKQQSKKVNNGHLISKK